MKVLDLFSGIGGFSLGLERAGMFTQLFCEIDPYAQKVLKKHWPDIPIHDDIRTLDYEKINQYARGLRCNARGAKQSLQGSRLSGETQSTMAHAKRLRELQQEGGQSNKRKRISDSNQEFTEGNANAKQTTAIDVICGGFPCQPYSVAGKRQGEKDDRALWPEMFRIIKEVQPRIVIAENVTGFIHLGLSDCLSDLESAGYRPITLIIPACGIGAPHRRNRIFIIAHANKFYDDDSGHGTSQVCGERSKPAIVSGSQGNVAHAKGKQIEREGSERFQSKSTQCGENVTVTIKPRLERFPWYVEDGDQSRRNETEPNGSISKGSFRNATKQGLQDRPEGTIRQSGSNKQSERSDRGPTESQLRGISDGISKRLDGNINVWQGEWPDTPRVSKGVPRRVDRLKCLGNAVVPQIVQIIGEAIMAIEKGEM